MAKPVISNIRPGDPDGNVWDLNVLENDEFFALNDDTPAFDDLVAMLNLENTGLTALDLDAYGYIFLGTNGSDTVTGMAQETGIIATGNGSHDITAGALDHILFAGNGTDTASGGAGNDHVFGENGKDLLAGNSGDDEVRGGKGKDTLLGGGGDDTLCGGKGVDVLSGGEGADQLTGGKGGDEFKWGATEVFGDVVTDFRSGSDKLVFDVGDEDPQISVGNDDLVVDDGEVVIGGEIALTADIQTEIDGNGHTSNTLFVFLDAEVGHGVVYYDPDPTVTGDAVLVAELTSITEVSELPSASDFMFV